jgi:hypothetical protein
MGPAACLHGKTCSAGPRASGRPLGVCFARCGPNAQPNQCTWQRVRPPRAACKIVDKSDGERAASISPAAFNGAFSTLSPDLVPQTAIATRHAYWRFSTRRPFFGAAARIDGFHRGSGTHSGAGESTKDPSVGRPRSAVQRELKHLSNAKGCNKASE